jgi:hypothetical protein
MTINAGNYAVFVLGVVLLIMSIRKVAVFTSNLVPFVLKVLDFYHNVATDYVYVFLLGWNMSRGGSTSNPGCIDANWNGKDWIIYHP